jgi:hypothetical protein
MREQIPNTENDESISNLLGGLERVEAPENFEFGVKARIASGEPKESTSPFGFVKIAVPTAAFAGLAAFLYMSGFMFGDIPPVQVAEEKPAVISTQETLRGETQEVPAKEPGTVSNLRETQIASARANGANNKTRAAVDAVKRPIGGGSIDQTLNPDRPIKRAIPVQRVLETAGISAEFQGDRCVANSVSGPAERIGVKGGDVILTVNNVPIKSSTTFEDGVELKSVRVNRAGRNLKLSF